MEALVLDEIEKGNLVQLIPDGGAPDHYYEDYEGEPLVVYAVRGREIKCYSPSGEELILYPEEIAKYEETEYHQQKQKLNL